MRKKKGSVHLCVRNGMLSLSLTFQGQRSRRALGLSDTPTNRQAIRGIMLQIEADIILDRFAGLESYLPNKRQRQSQPSLTTPQLFQSFADSRPVSEYRRNTVYAAILSYLNQHGKDIKSRDGAKLFTLNLMHLSPATYNSYLFILKAFGAWLAETDQGANYWDGLPSRTATRSKTRPFSDQEAAQILNSALQEQDPVYYGYILCLLTSGARVSECLGFRWADLDFKTGQLSITSALGRSGDGRSSGATRQRRNTKTGDSGHRTLTLPPDLCEFLESRRPEGAIAEDLIFQTTKGNPLDDHNFSQRVWRRILARAGVPHRPPTTCRHTTISKLIEAGASLPQAAAIAGHRDTTMVSRVYGHAMSQPSLPNYVEANLCQSPNPGREKDGSTT